ncbi:NAD(P)H-hydrate dehydratase [Acidiphilium iwatense]|uniref:Bifunctional NAD(P)H-hydrate repair enzyme n=2 Tax=Acidiphilium iwatense TaxID=768198 RepID=A0ABS9DVJ8_9PROT|nr:NAD(P)H-hydrate dehydratase [Acidiphilium iwatense]
MEPLFTPREMAAIDAAAPNRGTASLDLMENAGRAVTRAILRRYPPCRVLVLAGPGNNGGDGYVAARLLAERGWPVAVAPIARPRAGSDAAIAAARWDGLLVSPETDRIRAADLVIDAVFGSGLAREIAPDIAEQLATAGTLVAIDMPSGVDGATGAIRGFAPRAALTVTFVARKPGHLLYPGRARCGEVVCADIGMPAGAIARIAPTLWRNAPGLWRLPGIAEAGHKYDRGHLTILAGAMPGAAILAANAALRAGAGLVTLSAEQAIAGAPPGLIVRTDRLSDLIADTRRRVWLCGPGLGVERAGAALDALIAAGRAIVADADALTACADAPERLRGVSAITPHEGEFARIFPGIDGDKLSAARAAAARTDTVVVLKGADTVIAAPDGRAAINDNAPPTLATAGCGDTLAGIIAGLLTRKMNPFEAACAAVWLHGEAARRIGPGLIAEDLANALPETIKALAERRSS